MRFQNSIFLLFVGKICLIRVILVTVPNITLGTLFKDARWNEKIEAKLKKRKFGESSEWLLVKDDATTKKGRRNLQMVLTTTRKDFALNK